MSDGLTPEPRRPQPGTVPDGEPAATERRPVPRLGFRSLAVDARPLRESQPFRRLWVGQLISLVGRQITTVAVPFEVYSLTRSALDVGLLGVVQAVPLVCGSIGGGAIADRFDRRRVLIVTQLCLAACSGLLALGAFIGHPPLLEIYAVVALAALVGAVDAPTRTAIIPNLVGVDRLAGALSLNIVLFQTTLVAGPAIGGLVIAHLGLPAAFSVDVITFSAALTAVALLPPQGRPSPDHERPIAAIRRGLSFARRQPVILGGFAMDLAAMIFGMPRAVFPVLAATTFHAGAQGLGLLYAAPGLGAVVAALTSGGVARSKRLGRIIVVAIVVWGLVIIAFGFAQSLWVALLLLAVAGGADSFSAVCRTTIMQRIAPDELRGRLTSLYYMVVVGGPNLGDVETGFVANAFGAEVAIVTGGALCLVGLGAAAVAFPSVWRYRTDS
ncbi:MAG TPA: MFS transporter [Candidatus Saccharimonadales bacterium]|nr:MFS transporter [Candidatus Saccharimonadales bacterium]